MNEELNIKKDGVKQTVKEVQTPIKKGLKTKEALFNKDKQLQGRIDYSYN